MKIGNNLWRDIEARNKPTVVLALGNSYKIFNIDGKLHEVRGSVYRVKRRNREMFVIPTYAPRDLKKPERMFSEDSVLKSFTCAGDIQKAVRVYKHGWEVPKENFNLNPTVDEVESFVEEAISKKYLLGTDLEGTGLNIEHSEVVVAGFAWSESDAIVVPFKKEGGQDNYPPSQMKRVKTAVQRLLNEGRFMYQNGVGYDIPLLRQRGLNVPLENFEVDTMVLHHTISPELPHKIGFISSQYGKQPYWKDGFLTRKEHIYETNQEEMRRYNARDCVALHQIYNGMTLHINELIEDEPEIYGGLWKVFNDAMEVSRAIVVTEEQGLLLDKKKEKEWQNYVDERIEKAMSELTELVSLPPHFNMGSGADIRWWLYHEKPTKLENTNYERELKEYDSVPFNYQYECPHCGRKRTKKFRPELEDVPNKIKVKCPKCNIEVTMGRTEKEPNEVKGKNKDTVAYRKLKALEELANMPLLPRLRNYIPLKTEQGQSAIDKSALTRYTIHIDKRLDRISNLKRKADKHVEEEKNLRYTRSVLIVLQEYNSIRKLKESFYQFQTRRDGKVYPHFLVTGTATGRFSSKDPNFQQVPSGEIGEKVRSCFRAMSGNELMSVDFENLEVVIGAYFMEDQALIDIVEAGVNFHDFNNKVFFGVDESDPMWKTYRKVAKVIVFARIMYGGSDNGIHTKVMTQQPDCGLTLEDFKKAIQNYMDAHPDYVAWCEKVIATAKEKRISVNAYGRVRTLLGEAGAIERQALNSPIQGSAADAVREDMVMLHKRFIIDGLKARIVLQIHDEFVFEYPKEERDKVAKIVKEIMGRTRTINGRDFTIGLDAEVGTHWGSLSSLNLDTMEVVGGSKH